MASKSPVAKATPKAKATTRKPARKGTARTSNGPASAVATRKLSASERKSGSAKLGKPTPTRAKAKATPAKGRSRATAPAENGIRPETAKVLNDIARRRSNGEKWNAIADATGIALGTLARLRTVERTKGADRF